ncbi:MAG: glycine cleavage T C-terminal barrel domain-containing protein, partial [Pseudomonadota bacterium]
MAGFSQGGGVGLALSNWMVDGDPGYDIFAMDVARYGDFTSLRYTNAKVRENYSRRFSIRFPNEELPAARPQQTTPLYDIMVRDNNAVMGDTWGLETPLWFAPAGTPAEDLLSFHRSNDFEHVGNEVKAVRSAVGVTEIANFAKYEFTGPGATAFLDKLMTNRLPRPGRLCLTPMLNERGKLIGDFTIACATPERYMMWGSSGAQIYHMRWFEQHLPKDGSVRIHRFGQTLVGLSIAGPKSRELLQRLVDWPVDNASLKFMDYREMDVAGCPTHLNRISYSGDLGYELWMEPCYERRIYTEIKRLGADLGIVDFGMRALLSMRLEKNFPTWFAELRPIYGPYEADMGRFIKLDKGDFIGRDAAQAEKASGGSLRRVTLAIDTDRTDVMAHEPIWARRTSVDKVDSAVVVPHGYGARRFDENNTDYPKPAVQSDGDWQVVGWVTSGGYGHSVGASLAQGYLPKALVSDSNSVFQVEILGKRFDAELVREPLFDPAREKMLS